MRYSEINLVDIVNGKYVGSSLFVQGCHFHCKNCFNQSTWDFSKGKEWNEDVKELFIKNIDKDYIKRVSILGGEPLADENVSEINLLIKEIKRKFPDKKIWIYSGYTWEEIFPSITKDLNRFDILRQNTIFLSDFFVDGRFIDELKDLTLKFRGSKNQRKKKEKKTLASHEYKIQEVLD